MPIYLHKYGFLQFHTLAISAVSIWQCSFFPLSKISILIHQSSSFPSHHHFSFFFLSWKSLTREINLCFWGFRLFAFNGSHCFCLRAIELCYIRSTDTHPFLISACSIFPSYLGKSPLVVAYYYCSIFTPS